MPRPCVARAGTLTASPQPIITTPYRAPRKRGNPEREEIYELKECNKVLEMQLRSPPKQNKKVKDQLARVTIEHDQDHKLLKEKVGGLEQEVVQLELRKLRLSYKELYPGGVLLLGP